MANRGGARKGAGRKKGIGITYDIQKHCQNLITELLKDDAIKLKATKQLALTFKEEEEDYLYIIESQGMYKIGYSSNWKKRIKSYKTHLPDVNLIYLTKQKDCFELESHLHKLFSQYRKENTEWFDLLEEDIIEAISYCSSKIE